MKPLGDFLREDLKALPALTADGLKARLVPALREGLPPREAADVAEALEQYAASAEFADRVNQAVPPPRPGETEEQFVERAKASIRDLLLSGFAEVAGKEEAPATARG